MSSGQTHTSTGLQQLKEGRLMKHMAERELFSVDYDVPPDRLWDALKRSLRTMDAKEVLDDERSARFATGVTTFSWGQHNVARVEHEDGRSRLDDHGRPKASILTSNLGERMHARRVRTRLTGDIESELSAKAAF